jgi:signal transduction histidine kinase
MTRALTVSIALAGASAVVGLAVESFGSGLAWVPDLATGWAIVAAGVAAARLVPGSPLGPLLASAGLLWFAGNNDGLDGVALLYRAPLVYAVLTAPMCRPRTRLHGIAVAGVSVAAASPEVADSLAATSALSAAILIVALQAPAGAAGGTVLAAALAGGAAAAHAAGPGEAGVSIIAAYGAGLAIAAGATVVAAVRAARPDALVDRLVASAGRPAGAFRDAVADAVGDRTLQVYFAADRPAPAEAPGRQRTTVGEAATLLHRPGAFDEPHLREAVAAATLLQADNVELQQRLTAQGDALAASGRRLLAAGDEQRRRLGRRVEQRPVARLEALDERLAALPGEGAARARATIEDSITELRRLAIGLHPGLADGADLRQSLERLARRSPIHVDVITEPVPSLNEESRTALLFACSEALANVIKHADASRADVRLEERSGAVVLVVSDDGRGGADVAAGSGLGGLRARLELLGGALSVISDQRSGTRVEAAVPVAEVCG